MRPLCSWLAQQPCTAAARSPPAHQSQLLPTLSALPTPPQPQPNANPPLPSLPPPHPIHNLYPPAVLLARLLPQGVCGGSTEPGGAAGGWHASHAGYALVWNRAMHACKGQHAGTVKHAGATWHEAACWGPSGPHKPCPAGCKACVPADCWRCRLRAR